MKTDMQHDVSKFNPTEDRIADYRQALGNFPNILEKDQFLSGYSITLPADKANLPGKELKKIKKYITNLLKLIYFFSLIAITVLALLEAVIMGVEIDIGSGLVLSIFGSKGRIIKK